MNEVYFLPMEKAPGFWLTNVGYATALQDVRSYNSGTDRGPVLSHFSKADIEEAIKQYENKYTL